MSQSEPHVTVLAVTEIADRCSYYDCDEPAVTVAAYHSSRENDVALMWLCGVDGATFNAPDATTDVVVQEITRTCRAGEVGQPPCGGYATHVVLVGYEYDDDRAPEIRVTSSCERHAGEVAEDLLPPDTA
jgi:hypothetical protein